MCAYKYIFTIHGITGTVGFLFEEIVSTISEYFLSIICGAIALVFVAALINRMKLSRKGWVNFEVYKKDWRMSHMYDQRIEKGAHPFLDRWLKFNFVLGKSLATIGFSPNLTSLLALILSIASAFYFIQAGTMIPDNLLLSDLFFALAVAFLLLSGLADILDGAVARLTYSSTPFGDLLDDVADKYSDAIVIISIIYAGLCDPFIGLAALLGSLLVDYARARTMSLGLRRTKVTIGERPFRMLLISSAVAFQFVAQLSVALDIKVPIGEDIYLHTPFLNTVWWSILILAVITHFSTIHLALHARRNLPNQLS